MPLNDMKYRPVPQHDLDMSSPGVDDTFTTEGDPRPKAVTRSIHRWEWITRDVLLLLSLVFLVLWVTSIGTHKCTYVTKYSLANEAIEYIEHFKYAGGRFFTTPWRGNDTTDETGNPGPDVDAAWRRISTDVKPIRITEDQFYQMGMEVTPTTVKLPEEEGGGYLASLEVTHHLWCLDMLRRATYREYYASFDPAFRTENEVLMNQLDTCVELIRQALMCYPDLNMVIYYWMRGFSFPNGNTSTIHKCKNFDKILDWASDKAVHVPRVNSAAGN